MATVGNVAQDNQGGMLVAVAIALLPTQESVPVGRSNFGSPKVWKSEDVLASFVQVSGEARAKRVVVDPDSTPNTVAAVAASLPASHWYRRKVSEGTKGPIAYAFARQRVTLCKDGLPDRTVWLLIKRTLGAEPSYAYAISNAPASPPLSTLVWLRRSALGRGTMLRRRQKPS